MVFSVMTDSRLGGGAQPGEAGEVLFEFNSHPFP